MPKKLHLFVYWKNSHLHDYFILPNMPTYTVIGIYLLFDYLDLRVYWIVRILTYGLHVYYRPNSMHLFLANTYRNNRKRPMTTLNRYMSFYCRCLTWEGRGKKWPCSLKYKMTKLCLNKSCLIAYILRTSVNMKKWVSANGYFLDES